MPGGLIKKWFGYTARPIGSRSYPARDHYEPE
jgi:hypothetical protein